jgi:ribA/ribD-fused uncharacterized protein
MIGLQSDMKEIRTELDSIKDLKQSVTFTQDELLEVKKDINKLRQTVEQHGKDSNDMSNKLILCIQQNREMHEKLLHLDTYIRRENLKFTGIKEDRNESAAVTEKKIRRVFVDQLEIEYGREIEFQRCHRLGGKATGNREIIVRFLWFQDRETVWNMKSKLKGSNVVVKEDFPIEIEERRSRLYPILKAARSKDVKVLLKADKLILDGQRYTVDTLDKLPPDFQPAHFATVTKDKSVLFHGKDSFLSNFHPAPFELDGESYTGSEQFFQYKKAVRIGDKDVASKILSTDNPIEQMRLGRKLLYTEDQWNDEAAEQHMEVAVKAKFQQNPELKKKLLETGQKMLIECNVHDSYWGNGRSLYDKDAKEQTKWKGKNKMGEVLCRVRETLK